jgi:hypothetical protein
MLSNPVYATLAYVDLYRKISDKSQLFGLFRQSSANRRGVPIGKLQFRFSQSYVFWLLDILIV